MTEIPDKAIQAVIPYVPAIYPGDESGVSDDEKRRMATDALRAALPHLREQWDDFVTEAERELIERRAHAQVLAEVHERVMRLGGFDSPRAFWVNRDDVLSILDEAREGSR